MKFSDRAGHLSSGRLTTVHIDASTLDGDPNKISGIGVVINSNGKQTLISRKIKEKDSGRAELRAAYEALRLIKKNNLTPAILITDSMNAVSLMYSATDIRQKAQKFNQTPEKAERFHQKFSRKYGNLFAEIKKLLTNSENIWIRWQGRRSSKEGKLADKLARKESGVYGRQRRSKNRQTRRRRKREEARVKQAKKRRERRAKEWSASSIHEKN